MSRKLSKAELIHVERARKLSDAGRDTFARGGSPDVSISFSSLAVLVRLALGEESPT